MPGSACDLRIQGGTANWGQVQEITTSDAQGGAGWYARSRLKWVAADITAWLRCAW